jgi:hypothetical protein
MSFLKSHEFKSLYGERTFAIARKLEKLYQKEVKTRQHINFLQLCKSANLIPNGMVIKNTTKLNKNNKKINNVMMKIRNNTLEWKHKYKRFNDIEIRTQENILKIYMVNTHPLRNHINDLRWINKYDKIKEKSIIKDHQNKIKELKTKKMKQEEKYKNI